jgi:hypothetical protein
MRQAILDGIAAVILDPFSVSQELPYTSGGQPLYFKNFRVFYVAEPESTESNLFNTLDAGIFARKETTIRAFVQVDAKLKPPNYNSVVEGVRNVKNTTEITGVVSRECDIVTSFEADSLLTEFVFRFTETKIN